MPDSDRMTPRQWAKSIVHAPTRPDRHNEEWWLENITEAIASYAFDRSCALHAALEDVHRYKVLYEERGELAEVMRAEIQAVSTERNAALEDLARVTRERDAANESANIQCEIRYSELARAEKAERERDGLAVALCTLQQDYSCDRQWLRENGCSAIADALEFPASTILAAHNRQVAARVLREMAPYLENQGNDLLHATADAYESGEREVPGE